MIRYTILWILLTLMVGLACLEAGYIAGLHRQPQNLVDHTRVEILWSEFVKKTRK